MLTIAIISAVAAIVIGLVLAGRRHHHKAQAPAEQESEPMTWQLDEAADRALEAETRQELEQCSTADLQAVLDGSLFMFSRDAGGMEFRWRVTTRRRIAQELLDEHNGVRRPDPENPVATEPWRLRAGRTDWMR